MPLITEKSILSNILKPKQKQTPEKPIFKNQGVNNFIDTHAKGFITFKQPKETDFIIDNKSINTDTTFQQSQPQQFIDLRGNRTIEFTQTNRVSIDKKNSRLLNLHEKGVGANSLRLTDDGFTNYLQATTLDKYYGRLKSNTGILGIRNDKISQIGFEQPYVIKDIGDRWGFDGVQSSKFINPVVAKIVNFTGGLLDDLGGAVLGRSPNEYMGNAIGGLERMGKFLLTSQGAGFLLKQDTLKKRNKQRYRTDVKYGLTSNEVKKTESIRGYNVISLGSLPGVTKININKIDPFMRVEPYFDSIASLISKKVIDIATNVKKDIISSISTTYNKSSLKTRIDKNVANLKEMIPNGITTSVKTLQINARALDRKRQAFDEFTADVKDAVSKATGVKINPNVKVLSQVGKDKVNLIPYGKRDVAKDSGTGLTEEELDFVPFRFEAGDGNLMVFRAILSGITDTFTPEYSSERYVGRPDSVYVYQGTTREISFTFDIYPKSDEELVTLWEKMNYLAGLTYPEWASANGGGQGMVAPFCKLTIGQMYTNTPGYISGLTYTVQDNGTWETTFAKLPKYIQASCTFVYIGDRLPSSTQKHYELPWVAEHKYVAGLSSQFNDMLTLKGASVDIGNLLKVTPDALKGFLNKG